MFGAHHRKALLEQDSDWLTEIWNSIGGMGVANITREVRAAEEK